MLTPKKYDPTFHQVPPVQGDIFAGPPTPAQILGIPAVQEWVDERVAIMIHDGGHEEADAQTIAKGRAVKLFRSGGFGI